MMGINEDYLDIPPLARKGIITQEQYDKQKKYNSHKEIEDLAVYRFRLKKKLNRVV
jgi:hypothetical protein